MAMRAQKVLSAEGYQASLAPAPSRFISEGAMALRLSWAQAGVAAPLLKQAGIEVAGIHEIT
jgi:hypothetical protein